LLHEFQGQSDHRLIDEVLNGLREMLARRAADDLTNKLVSGWLTGGGRCAFGLFKPPGDLA
jgi:hypothetical protein